MSTPLLEQNHTPPLPAAGEGDIDGDMGIDPVDVDDEIARERVVRVAHNLRRLDMLSRELSVRGVTDPVIAARTREVLEAKRLIRELASLAGVEYAKPEQDASASSPLAQTLPGVRAL